MGNVQRLNVAIGLVADPAVVFLDEPTASLDPRQRGRLWELLRGVTGRGGAVVFATQNVEEAHTQADRLVVLQEGRLVFSGSQEQFWQQAGVENSSTGAFERAFVRFLDLQAEAAS